MISLGSISVGSKVRWKWEDGKKEASDVALFRAIVLGCADSRTSPDAHVHLFDCKPNTCAFLEHEDRSFKAIAGDFGPPQRYLTDDYRDVLLMRDCWLLLEWFGGQRDACLPS